MKKNLNIKSKNTNLLNSRDFLSHLNFEVNYATIVKGGHAPYYFKEEKQKRLVSQVNILTSKEQQEIAFNLFINKN
jgi:hypothetical protein